MKSHKIQFQATLVFCIRIAYSFMRRANDEADLNLSKSPELELPHDSLVGALEDEETHEQQHDQAKLKRDEITAAMWQDCLVYVSYHGYPEQLLR
jgi:hypothetical protein